VPVGAGALEDSTDRRGADAVAELERLALHPAISPARGFVAIRMTSAVSISAIGGLPGRFA